MQTHDLPRVPVRTVEIASDDSLLSLLPEGHVLSWVRHGEGLVGWGEYARFEVTGAERFSRAQRWWASFAAGADVDDSVQLPGTGPVAFCSFTFDVGPASSVVIVPRAVVGRHGGRTWLTTIGATEEDEATTSQQPASPPRPHAPVEWLVSPENIEDWSKAVATAVERINSRELDKVVLARDLVGETDRIDPRHLLTRLADDFPSCWTFDVDGLCGATPELLIRRSGDSVTSRVLAGTVRRRGDDDADGLLAQMLLGSDKDLEEHEYAVGSVASALAAHCTDLDVPEKPHVLRLANVQHLATDVSGRLADDAPALALAASLHPTAAVCGTPTERAFSLIRELEAIDRGRYAGPVGWIDAHGDGEFGIALRCGQLEPGPAGPDSRIRLYAGCGIVAGSEPDSEVAESSAKLEAVRRAMSS